MQSAQQRQEQAERRRMMEGAYWAALLLNAGTQGRKREDVVKPADLLPDGYAGAEEKPKAATARQKRAAEVKKHREVLWFEVNFPGFGKLESERDAIALAHKRLRELRAPDKPAR